MGVTPVTGVPRAGQAVTGTGSPAAAPGQSGPALAAARRSVNRAATGMAPPPLLPPQAALYGPEPPQPPQPAAPSRPAPRSCTRESPSVRRGRAGAGAAAHQLVTAQGGMSVMYCIRRAVETESGGGGGTTREQERRNETGRGESLCRVLEFTHSIQSTKCTFTDLRYWIGKETKAHITNVATIRLSSTYNERNRCIRCTVRCANGI